MGTRAAPLSSIGPIASCAGPGTSRILSSSTRTGPSRREAAPSLHRALLARDPSACEGELDYLAVVDPDTFEPVQPRPRALVIGAARFGSTRLIDNITLEEAS